MHWCHFSARSEWHRGNCHTEQRIKLLCGQVIRTHSFWATWRAVSDIPEEAWWICYRLISTAGVFVDAPYHGRWLFFTTLARCRLWTYDIKIQPRAFSYGEKSVLRMKGLWTFTYLRAALHLKFARLPLANIRIRVNYTHHPASSLITVYTTRDPAANSFKPSLRFNSWSKISAGSKICFTLACNCFFIIWQIFTDKVSLIFPVTTKARNEPFILINNL